MDTVDAKELQVIYADRFKGELEYRNRVWVAFCNSFWSRFIPEDASVLDLGCGYGQFINNIRCSKKWAMDLNPEARQHLKVGVTFLEQDCSAQWQLRDESLDIVFTSNFFEHLPDKNSLKRTLLQASRFLKPNAVRICHGE